MKIALLSYEYPPDTGYGGIGSYTFHQARGLAELGHEVTVFCGSARPARMLVRHEDGVRVVRLRPSLPEGWERDFERDQMWWTRGRMRNAVTMAAGLEELSAHHSFDVVEAPECGAEAALIAARGDWPLVIRFHSPAEMIMPLYDVRQRDQLLSRFVERLGIFGATRHTACSEYLALEAQRRFQLPRVPTVIHNGLDLAWFDTLSQSAAPQRVAVPRGNTIVFFGARLERRKGADLLADIMAPVLDEYPVSFVVAGVDNHQGIRASLARRLGRPRAGSFHYLGKVELDAVRLWLAEAAICLIPSRWENCPYSCLEAMATGTAVVASRVGGLPELVEDGATGLLVEMDDVPSFQSAVRRLVGDPSYAERLGQAARRRVEERFSARRMAEDSLREYERCLE
ncbi:MAG: glycosyltransferase family 4 protein [Pirellulales bacterium]